jgi:putative MATE family efflux protein
MPAILATLLISTNFIVDSICIGQKFGEPGLAALNVVVPITGFLYALGYLFAYGGSIQYSSALGAGDRLRARQAFTGSLVMLVGSITVVMVLGLVYLDSILSFLSGGSSIADTAREYLRYVFWFAAFYSLEIYFSVFLRNDGQSRRSMWGTITGSSLNIILDVLFIFVFEWGMIGASVATGLALVAAVIVEASGVLKKGSNLRLAKLEHYFRELWSYLRIGAPTFMRELSASLVVLIVNIILLRMSGETAVAAYGIVANLGTVVLCGLAGVSNAMQPLVSINAGAERFDRVKALLRMALIWSAALSMVYLVVAEIFPELLTAIFVDSKNPAFLAMSLAGIRWVSPSYLLAGLVIVLNVYLESLQANKLAFVLSMSRGILIPVLCVTVFSSIWGVKGVWYSFLAAELLSIVLGAGFVWRVLLRQKDLGGQRIARMKERTHEL